MTDASVFVGQSWESPEGVRTVVEERGGRFLVSTAGGLPQIMSESDVRFDMRRDAANLASRQRGAAQRESERTEQSEREDTQGFLESRTPMQATKALVALMTQMRFSGEFLTRKAFIERAVREGYTVEGTNLVSPSGSYYEQKVISKTALDYARHLIGLRDLKENPHHPDVLEILERKFPLDWGFWGFDVKKHIEKDAFGYLAPIGVEVKALPGEEVVTIRHHRKDPTAARYGEGSDEDFTGAKAIFTPEPIPAAQVIEFGLYPDYYALPHFLIEILNGADHVELQNARGDLALIHRDTYPSEMREHRGKVADYRVTYFDEHGPSGHHNGDFYGLILEALGGGYRRLAPGALDRLGL